MRVRTLLAPWYDIQTNSDRLLEAVSLVRQHLGNAPWFIGGLEAINTYMEEEPSLLFETPPEDIGLGIVLTIPDPPNLAEHVTLSKHISPPWPGPPHDEAEAARLQIRACQILKQTPPPESVALVKAVQEHIEEHVDKLLRPIRQQLTELLEARTREGYMLPEVQSMAAHITDDTPGATYALRKLGWMPPVEDSTPKK